LLPEGIKSDLLSTDQAKKAIGFSSWHEFATLYGIQYRRTQQNLTNILGRVSKKLSAWQNAIRVKVKHQNSVKTRKVSQVPSEKTHQSSKKLRRPRNAIALDYKAVIQQTSSKQNPNRHLLIQRMQTLPFFLL
jgi:hypothetical protein